MTTKILIAALDRDCGIGKNGGLPWHRPEDLREFRRLTEFESVAMGMSTFQGLLDRGLAPLSRRQNIVITHQAAKYREHFASQYSPNTLTFTSDIHCRDVEISPANSLLYIGGSTIYTQVLYSVALDRIHLSRFAEEYACDTFFPRRLAPTGCYEPDLPGAYRLDRVKEIPEEDGKSFPIHIYTRTDNPSTYGSLRSQSAPGGIPNV
jgi:dihydrofolate reductase